MFLSGKKGTLDRKAYEIAYALCRIAPKIEVKSFSEVIIAQGFSLLGAISRGNYEEARHLISGIDFFVKLGVDVSYISPQNGEIFAHELLGMIAVLDEPEEGDLPANDVSIDDIFSQETATSKKSKTGEAKKNQFSGIDASVDFSKKMASGNPAIFSNERSFSDSEMMPDMIDQEVLKMEDDGAFGETLSAGIEIRQSSILDRIRQSGNCRMKDFLEILPNSSERTIRYDLESLIDRKLIERVGGGSATYYRALD
jgi:hypothetical protein